MSVCLCVCVSLCVCVFVLAMMFADQLPCPGKAFVAFFCILLTRPKLQAHSLPTPTLLNSKLAVLQAGESDIEAVLVTGVHPDFA